MLNTFQIRYWLKKDNNLYDAEALNYLSRSKKPWALILGLIPNTYYYVQVMAYNSAGPGPASEPIYGKGDLVLENNTIKFSTAANELLLPIQREL